MCALLLSCLAASSARAAAPPDRLLVVADLKPLGVDAALARSATDALLEGLRGRAGWRVLGRSEIALLLEHERQRSLMACDEESCLADLGGATKADVVCSGTVGQVGNAFLLSASLTDVRAARVLARTSQTALAPEELLAAARRAADALISPGASAPKASRFAFPAGAGKGKVSLAVLDLAATGVAPEVVQTLTQVVVDEVKNLPSSTVISRDEVRALLEHGKERSMLGCDDAACLAELGGALGVQYLVFGTVGRVGDTYLMHLKLIGTRNARIAHRVAEAFSGEEAQLVAAARFAARSLVGLSREGEGTLEVRPTVSDARVLLDGKAVEGAQSLEAGKYNLRLEADGYQPWFGDVYVDAGARTRLDVELKALPQPWYRKWWVWTAAGAVAAGATTAAILAKRGQKSETTYNFGLQVQFPSK